MLMVVLLGFSIKPFSGTINGGYFISGRSIQLRCAYGILAKFISFQHNGSQILAHGRFSVQRSYFSHILTISNAQPTDEGTWSCTVQAIFYKKIFVSTKLIYEGWYFCYQIN